MRRRAIRSSAIRNLGMVTPLPFVGREPALAALTRTLEDDPVVVVRGPAGSGKSRLAAHFVTQAVGSRFDDAVLVRCEPGDRIAAVLARAERRAKRLPGSLARALRGERLLVVIDDVHRLTGSETVYALDALIPATGDAPGRVLLLGRDEVASRRDSGITTLELVGLEEAAARQLWHLLEERFGPTPHGACDGALVRTRGMPLALHREYACAAHGPQTWNLAELTGIRRRILDIMAVLGLPVPVSAVATLASRVVDADERSGVDRAVEVEATLSELVAHQLVEPTADGCFAVHESVREQAFHHMDSTVRSALERACAVLLSEPTHFPIADGGLSGLGPVDQLREQVRHWIAAGDLAQACARIVESQRDAISACIGGAEILALCEMVQASGGDDGELDAVQARIVSRRGHIAQALELYELHDGSSAGRDDGEHSGTGSGGPGFRGGLDRVERAILRFRSGDVASARRLARKLMASDDPDERGAATALVSEIALLSGDSKAAESLAAGTFARDRSAISEPVRARLHLALAAVEEHLGRISAARAALSRAASAGRQDPGLAALIETRRSACLAREGRVSEAASALADAEKIATTIDAIWVVDEIRRCEGLVAARRGDARAATELLRELVADRRQRGDEIGALRAEIDLATVLVRRGELVGAAELASVCSVSLTRRKLLAMAAEVRLVGALIDLAELRLNSAEVELEGLLGDPAASAELRYHARVARRIARAHAGHPVVDEPPGSDDGSEDLVDDIVLGQAAARVALAQANSQGALDALRSVAVRAERTGRSAELADALAMVARLLFARGDRPGALRAAQRAVREAEACGLSSARAAALLVCASLAREDGRKDDALGFIREVADIAATAGLPIERLLAAEARDAITGVESSRTADVRNAAGATLSREGLEAAGRILSDLGLTAVRPYRVVGAGGAESFVADANPDLLRMEQRSLAVDAVREVLVRSGEQIADLRRRSLLKRLLFLFASAPGHIFSKEDIVQTVWQVEYHPLRHDAALFTNIMRIRRLLGKDGPDLIRVSEDGYRFVPPKDYLYIERHEKGRSKAG